MAEILFINFSSKAPKWSLINFGHYWFITIHQFHHSMEIAKEKRDTFSLTPKYLGKVKTLIWLNNKHFCNIIYYIIVWVSQEDFVM